jgi:hypothetical protein
VLIWVTIKPEHAIKISFSVFAFNILMALLASIFPPYFQKQIFEASLLNKFSMIGVLFYLLFNCVPAKWYEWLIFLIGPTYKIF